MICFRIIVFWTIMIYSSKYKSAIANNNRARSSKFNVLLNLYKMNPLKESNVYKQFVQQTMSKTESSKIDPNNFETDEATKRRTKFNLKRIEKIIHRRQKKVKKVDENYYDINNVESEKFTVYIVTKSPELQNPTRSLNDLATEHFNNIFRHVESEEIDQYNSTSEADESLAITMLNTTKTSTTTRAYEEPTTTIHAPSITKAVDSIEFYKLSERKNNNILTLPAVNGNIQKKYELNIPINNENGLSLPVIKKDDKSESDLIFPDNNKDIKNEDELFLPYYDKEKRNIKELYLPNYNVVAVKEESRPALSYDNERKNENYLTNYNNELNIPFFTRYNSKNDDVLFQSNNKIDEKNNNLYLPINSTVYEKEKDMYQLFNNIADQRRYELYSPSNYNAKNENISPNVNNNNLKANMVNLQNQMDYLQNRGGKNDNELFLAMEDKVDERKPDVEFPIDKTINERKENIYLPIISRPKFKNNVEYSIHDTDNGKQNEIDLPNIKMDHDMYLPVEKKEEINYNDRRGNGINLANGNMFNNEGTNSVLDVVILR